MSQKEIEIATEIVIINLLTMAPLIMYYFKIEKKYLQAVTATNDTMTFY